MRVTEFEKFLTVPEAVEASRLSRETIVRAIRAGDLRATKPRINGRPIHRQVVDPAELRRWLNDQAVR